MIYFFSASARVQKDLFLFYKNQGLWAGKKKSNLERKRLIFESLGGPGGVWLVGWLGWIKTIKGRKENWFYT